MRTNTVEKWLATQAIARGITFDEVLSEAVSLYKWAVEQQVAGREVVSRRDDGQVTNVIVARFAP